MTNACHLERQISIGTNSKIPNFLKEFSIKMGTSQVGLGSELTQEYNNKVKQTYACIYSGRSLKGAKRQFSITDIKERMLFRQ